MRYLVLAIIILAACTCKPGVDDMEDRVLGKPKDFVRTELGSPNMVTETGGIGTQPDDLVMSTWEYDTFCIGFNQKSIAIEVWLRKSTAKVTEGGSQK